MTFNLNEKRVLITGASGEIGASIARVFHSQGCILTVSGTKKNKLEELVKGLGDRHHILTCDLSQLDLVENLPKLAAAAMGGIDILINNAGVTKDGLLMRMSNEDWSSVLTINLNATMCLTRGVLRGMLKSRWGRIINISSIVATAGNPGQANYAASKAGMIGMSKSLAVEVATRGITVNCIAPGFITSAMTDKLDCEQKNKLLNNVPMGRMGTPAEVAHAALYLASPEASYITGQTIHVNGGMMMV